MSPAIVYEGVRRGGDGANAGDNGSALFAGYKLWFSRTVPQRAWLSENAKANGATIVTLENDADIKLVDHARKEQHPGTHSYRWVEASIRNGILEDLAGHVIGLSSRADRPVGSITTASRVNSRAPYTEEEDRWLWNVMMPFILKGGQWKGNEIYKQIERLRPRHTYQSWRDHWIKVTSNQNRSITEEILLPQEGKQSIAATTARPVPLQRPTTPPQTTLPMVDNNASSQAELQRTAIKRHRQEDKVEPVKVAVAGSATPRISRRSSLDSANSHAPIRTPTAQRTPEAAVRSPVVFSANDLGEFTLDEARMVYRGTKAILETQPEHHDNCWSQFAEANSHHTEAEWRRFWESVVLPKYCERRGKTVKDLLSRFPKKAQQNPTSSAVKVENRTKSESSRGPKFEDWPNLKTVQIPTLTTKDSSRKRLQSTRAESSPDPPVCSRCFTTESEKWRHDKVGQPLCNNCRLYFKQTGAIRQSTALTEVPDDFATEPKLTPVQAQSHHAQAAISQQHKTPSSVMTPSRVDVGVQTSPLLPSAEIQYNTTPLHPQSPFQNRQPEPNEARKRSSAKSSQSNSQESKATENKKIEDKTGLEAAAAELPALKPSPRGRKRKLTLQDDPQTLEIPSTPENVNTQDHDMRPISLVEEDARHRSSPIPQTQISNKRPPRQRSPLFVPTDDEEEDDESVEKHNLAPPTPLRPVTTKSQSYLSSPPKVDFFDDQENTESDQKDDDDVSDTGSTRSVYQFDTAPEVSRSASGNWETAPQTPIQTESEGEDEVESQTSQAQSNLMDADDIALPYPAEIVAVIDLTSSNDDDMDIDKDDEFEEPEDWSYIQTPRPDQRYRKEHATAAAAAADSDKQQTQVAPASQDLPDSQSSSDEPTDLDTWITAQTSLYPETTDIDLILQTAIEATSFDFLLAGEVVKDMIRIQAKGKQKAENQQQVDADGREKQEQQGGTAIVHYLPRHVRGCWTAEDDNLLFSQDAKDVFAVEQKHGMDNCTARFEFLEAMANS